MTRITPIGIAVWTAVCVASMTMLASCGDDGDGTTSPGDITTIVLRNYPTEIYFTDSIPQVPYAFPILTTYSDGIMWAPREDELTVSSSDTSVATIRLMISGTQDRGDGVTEHVVQPEVTTVGLGSATIRIASTADDTIFAEATVQVSKLLNMFVFPNPAIGNQGDEINLNAVADTENASGTEQVDVTGRVGWKTYTMNNCCEVIAPGTIKVIGASACMEELEVTFAILMTRRSQVHANGYTP